MGDVTNSDDVTRIVSTTVEKFGGIDVLVNNAGSTITGNLETTTTEDLETMFQVNTKSVFLMCKTAVPHLVKCKGNPDFGFAIDHINLNYFNVLDYSLCCFKTASQNEGCLHGA